MRALYLCQEQIPFFLRKETNKQRYYDTAQDRDLFQTLSVYTIRHGSRIVKLHVYHIIFQKAHIALHPLQSDRLSLALQFVIDSSLIVIYRTRPVKNAICLSDCYREEGKAVLWKTFHTFRFCQLQAGLIELQWADTLKRHSELQIGSWDLLYELH